MYIKQNLDIKFSLYKKIKAFTIFEILIVLLIINIFIMISYSGYSHLMTRAKRRHAQVALIHLCVKLEEYHAINKTYEDADFSKLGINNKLSDNSYQLRIAQLSENNFLIQAIPSTKQREHDPCGDLSLNEKGERTNSGGDHINYCWD